MGSAAEAKTMDQKRQKIARKPRLKILGRSSAYVKARYKAPRHNGDSVFHSILLNEEGKSCGNLLKSSHPSRSKSESEKRICVLCSQLRWNPNVAQWGRKSPTEPFNAPSEIFRHHKSLRKLQDSAESCPLCAMIRDEILQGYSWRKFTFEKVDILGIDFVRSRNRFSTTDVELSERDLSSAIFLWTHREDNLLIHNPSHIQIGTAVWMEEDAVNSERTFGTFGDLREAREREPFTGAGYPRLDAYTLDGDPFQRMGLSCRRDLKRNQTNSFPTRTMRRWIDDCISSHEECSLSLQGSMGLKTDVQRLPKRLLSLGGTPALPIIRLQENNKAFGRYVALSYCWGTASSTHHILTRNKVEDMRKNIEFQALPRTYRDAIIVTLALGIHYLWIDAMCIIQHSTEDWNAESQKMDQYYGNSTVTLCVDRAEGVDSGFLFARSTTFDPLHLRQRFPTGETANLMISRHMYNPGTPARTQSTFSTGLWRANVEICPLATRAWALQERLLSPRKLHFGNEEVFWECRSTRDAEGGVASIGGAPKLTHIATALARGELSTQLWYRLVQLLSVRNVTRQSDKLTAISSLAKVFHGVLGGDYRAGMWCHDLHNGLNWRVRHGIASERDDQELFPSWSWANSVRPVYFGEGFPDEKDPTTGAPCGFTLVSIPEAPKLDPYGAAIGMRLRIFGCLQRVLLRAESPRNLFPHPEFPDPSGQVAANGVIGDYYDDLSLPRNGDAYMTLRLFDVHPSPGPSLPLMQDVLVLETVQGDSGDHVFRRIGAGLVLHDNWFDGCDDQLITLI